MPRALCLSAFGVLLTLGIAACGAANVTNEPGRAVSRSDRAQPSARTSADETDGPTAPRGGAQRPIGEGAGYEEDGSGDDGNE